MLIPYLATISFLLNPGLIDSSINFPFSFNDNLTPRFVTIEKKIQFSCLNNVKIDH